jgi:hypothetical protein
MAIRAAIGVCCVVLICGGCKSHRKAQASVSAILMEDESHKDRILSGIYPGQGVWRWTAPTFSFILDQPAPGKVTYLEMDLRMSGKSLKFEI